MFPMYDARKTTIMRAMEHTFIVGLVASVLDENTIGVGNGKEAALYDLHLMTEPYEVPCMVEIFHFL